MGAYEDGFNAGLEAAAKVADYWGDGKWNIIEALRQRKATSDYQPPAADLGYCSCGTVWNIEAMVAEGFTKGTCPDCGEAAIEIEKS